MKKAYVKPKMYYESFILSSSISSSCEGIANLGENQCSVTIPDIGIEIFTSEIACEYTPPSGDDTICYHAPSDWNNVFSS